MTLRHLLLTAIIVQICRAMATLDDDLNLNGLLTKGQIHSGHSNTARGWTHIKDPTTGNMILDNTEGLGAFEDIFQFGFGSKSDIPSNQFRNIDIGGGRFDDAAEWLFEQHQIINVVYDPFNRSPTHNARILKECEFRPFDSSTSMSVLNVIDDYNVRMRHIELMRQCIKDGGLSFFKVWKGDGTGRGEIQFDAAGKEIGYQAHKDVGEFQKEVEQIYGVHNVRVVSELNLIIARKVK